MVQGIHTEETFEEFIEAYLVEHGGYEKASPTLYDRKRALIPEHVIDFVRKTQPKIWSALEAIHKEKLPTQLIDTLCQVLDKRGMLKVLREGFKFYGKKVRVAYFEPGHNLNPAVWELCVQNDLRLLRQLRYDPNNENELDLALFLNGLPIATAELKNPLTGQTVAHAKRQYREDRDKKAPIFRWTKRALVHFAVDTEEVWMTTKLAGQSTFFLPFNKGNANGAGNPAVEGKHRTHYLWEEVWARRSILDLLARFIHLQRDEGTDPNTGKKWTKETLIFPRYHQMDCVRRLVAGAREKGVGTNFLVQHSAGSGKSNSIAWLAYRLSSLHDENDKRVYDTVVVLTDRRVLDQQLQATIHQFDHKAGVVELIDRHSDQLANALSTGAPIIISTIHKFGFIQEKMEALPDRRYAIIVDEAHSSQSGEMAVTVKELLSDSSIAEKLAEEGEDLSTPDQLALRAALFRGPQPNMSFFGFTATPKFKTLELFGHKGADGKPAPFHLYSMRQAIEEGFILDVLRGYVTYRRFFKLAKAIAEDPDLDKRKASAALARFVDLHPTNIAQKTQIIIEHFRSCVMYLLGGKAKAMVVTKSRLQAVRYKQAFDKYIAERGYGDVKCLVAFSGEVRDDKVPDITYTEPQMNKGIKETELPKKFASDAYNVLIVAAKYQTGFDQPLLCAMYVDKKLTGVQAVQTLSRLNRTMRGKETTFVLDFVNEPEEILASFQDYYEATTTAEAVDPQRLYEIQHELEEFNVWTESEVNGFARVFYAMRADQKIAGHAKLNSWLDPAVDRFKELGADGPDRIERQDNFRGKLVAFKNLYGFLGQIVPFHDHELEKLYAFGRMLLKKLPRPEGGEIWEPGDDVVLASIKLKKDADGDLALATGKDGELSGPLETGTKSSDAPKEKLSTIIELLNNRFGLNLPEHINKVLDGVEDTLVGDEKIQLAAKVNDKDHFTPILVPAFSNALLDHHQDNTDFVNLVFQDERVRSLLNSIMLDRVYGRLSPSSDDAADTTIEIAEVLPFRRVPLDQVIPFKNAVPAIDLRIAAGAFSASQAVEGSPQSDAAHAPGRYEWVALSGPTKPAPDLFIAQVVGESMNRRIPNGAWCLWRFTPYGADNGKVVLAQHRGIEDPETGGQYTVKVYDREMGADDEGTLQTGRITLTPDSTDERFKPIVLETMEEGELVIVAEFVEVLG